MPAEVLLELPAYIENFVKTCRAIKEYRDLDETYSALMTRAMLDSDKLLHLIGLIRNPSAYSKGTQDYITSLLRQSRLSMDQTSSIIDEWKRRLRIRDGPAQSRLRRLIPSFKIFSRGSDTPAEKSEEKGSYLHERLAEAEYMITGKLAIASAMDNLEHYLDDLNSAIISSSIAFISPEKAEGTTSVIEFVSHARQRRSSEAPVNLISLDALRPFSDVDPEMETGLYRVDSGPYAGCILDPRNMRYYINKGQELLAWKETENIARLFAEEKNMPDQHLAASVCIPPSCGYTALNPHVHGIVFRLPPDLAPPRTLRSLLIEGKVKHTLQDRVDFAIKLSMSVLVIHSLGLVHKNIKPDSILVAESNFANEKDLYPYKLGIPYLIAFVSMRSTTEVSMKEPFTGPNGPLLKGLYQHPRHHVANDNTEEHRYDYEMRDDIFSLGVCLLEISLWKSLFVWNNVPERPSRSAFKSNKDVLDLSDIRCASDLRARNRYNDDNMSWYRKHLLTEAAEEMIPPVMGTIFKDAVIACLKFGDSTERAASKDLQITPQIDSRIAPENQSLHFVREVLSKLHKIKL